MHLAIKIFTGDVTEKYLEKLKRRAGITAKKTEGKEEDSDATDAPGRTGHTFKKMIEAYEQGMQ